MCIELRLRIYQLIVIRLLRVLDTHCDEVTEHLIGALCILFAYKSDESHQDQWRINLIN